MGSPSGETFRDSDEGPQHTVTISNGFYLQTTEVTQAQWQAVMRNNPSYSKGDDLPVENVSWNDAQRFIKKLNEKEGTDAYRLPTEAEWEYACRAGTSSVYHWGEDMDDSYCWYASNASDKTHPVGQKLPNRCGLYDMSGNVWEWCQDWWGGYSPKPISDPQGPSSGTRRVLRGGGWNGFPQNCRSANRLTGLPNTTGPDFGFRVARDIE